MSTQLRRTKYGAKARILCTSYQTRYDLKNLIQKHVREKVKTGMYLHRVCVEIPKKTIYEMVKPDKFKLKVEPPSSHIAI